jgi:hypothetical protein
MSHATVLVLLSPGTPTDDLDAAIRPLLAPYSENMEVPEYDEPCWCVGSDAQNEARLAADASCGTLDDLRASFKNRHDDTAWGAHVKPYQDACAAALAAHPGKDAADPACSDCAGSGTRKSTYNPKSKWDWYTVGGRWSGRIPNDACAVADLPAGWAPFALVTPDGEWHESGKLGWFGMSSGNVEPSAWDATVREMLAQHADAFAVLVDYHI